MNFAGEPFTVNLYGGVLFRRDAISNSMLHKIETIDAMRRQGVNIDYRVFVLGTDYQIEKVTTVRSVGELATHPNFRDANMHIYEFGIHYALFDAILLKTGAPRIAVYHNVTPANLAPDAKARDTIEKSLAQRNNLFHADWIICDSEFNRRELIAFGIDEARLSTIHLPPSADVVFPGRPSFAAAPANSVTMLFVGRFVPAKGVLDLVRAMGIVKRSSGGRILLDLAGAARYSLPSFIAEIQATIAAEGVGDCVRVRGELTDDALAAAYRSADLFVMPSYHEGFCVPLLEAMSAGCFPIVYDAGNLPFLMARLGRLVTPGDVTGLAAAILDTAERIEHARAYATQTTLPTERGPMMEGEWRAAVRRQVAAYSRAAYDAAMTGFFTERMVLAGQSVAVSSAAAY